LGEVPQQARFIFDPAGSYAQVFRQQGADLAFITGMLHWPMTDARFMEAGELAAQQGVQVDFKISSLPESSHPNTVWVDLLSKTGDRLRAAARSTGGGAVEITRLNDWPVLLQGKHYEYLILGDHEASASLERRIESHGLQTKVIKKQEQEGKVLLHIQDVQAVPDEIVDDLKGCGIQNIWQCEPVFFVRKGELKFDNSQDMVTLAQTQGWTLGEIVWDYESTLLGLSRNEVMAEMVRRYDVMSASVDQGFAGRDVQMQLLSPSAAEVQRAEREGRLALGGIHARAAAAALAVMHVSNSMGVVCAAPTGGAAGTLPGVIRTLEEEWELDREQIGLALFAASGIGLILAHRATFAAETAGCQVEIGAAGAMAAAAVVELAGGNAQQAADAAAISFQNTMGSVCDLVQGMCEIPCHTRNAVAASSAFVCADLVLGGYHNPIPLDETIDAVFSSGKMLPSELRCTTLGGIAQAPSALALPRRR
jgi:L-serine dehydratase